MSWGSLYFGFLGVVLLVFGAIEFITGLPGIREVSDLGWLSIPGDAWRGIITFFSGLFVFMGSVKFQNIHGLGEVVLGLIMLWIVAGCDIFSTVLESIPGGEEGWFNTFQGFVSSYTPPYAPELWLFPFSVVVIYFIRKRGGG